MDFRLRKQADLIISETIKAVLPDRAVKKALEQRNFPGRIFLVAVGKAAWQMAKTAYECIGEQIEDGIIITKYHHIKGPVGNFICREAGHPIPDENSFSATKEAIQMVRGLTSKDTVLFLLSGGGSALFESPLIEASLLQDLTNQLLSCGANIKEINTIRKRLSAVKGGRFAQICAPARVYSIVLSDVLGDPLDMIASGPACPDSSTYKQALEIIQKYNLSATEEVLALLQKETPKTLKNVTTKVTGSVRQLCASAEKSCQTLGYKTILLTDELCCEAKEAGSFLSSIIRSHVNTKVPLAFIAGGETIVKLTGTGKGGRNQELALAAAIGIEGIPSTALFSIGSDGTDGPTDAAGGYVDWTTAKELQKKDIDIYKSLQNHDSYHALQAVDGLIFTGPTGTNVNDVTVAFISK